MQYVVHKAISRFRLNFRKYLFLIFQICIGTALIATSLNIQFSFEEKLSSYSQKVENLYINISSNISEKSDVLSIDDYEYINKNLKLNSIDMSYYKEYYLSDSMGNDILPILFVDENFYQLIMQAKSFDKNNVYIGSKALQMLGNLASDYYEKDRLLGLPVSKFSLLKEIDYQSEALLSDAYLSGESEEKTFENYVIFPVAFYDDLEESFNCFNNIAIIYDDNSSDLNKQIQGITNYLSDESDSGSFHVTNNAKFAEDYIKKNVHVAEALSFLSIFIFVIVIFGFIGLLLIILSKREKEFSTALMCGATKRQITIEIFIEILSVILIGILLGNLLSFVVILMLGSSFAEYHLFTLFVCMLSGLGISVLVCILSLFKIKYISPVISS